ncbi:unnamed protein product [Meloidogyne enterolobii]|uniref:Uncharacterized protein n=1 Tax=Meloidogyne enterolobii TaxID=390850 RepID=A0ACB0YXZ4_MELEN
MSIFFIHYSSKFIHRCNIRQRLIILTPLLFFCLYFYFKAKMFRHRVRARERVRRRAHYEELRNFRTTQAFDQWWTSGERTNWRINSRHPHVSGTVEYWTCSFVEGRRRTCPARLRITFDRDKRFVSVCRAKDRQHCHPVVETIVNEDSEILNIQQVAPYKMETARIIRVTTIGSTLNS